MPSPAMASLALAPPAINDAFTVSSLKRRLEDVAEERSIKRPRTSSAREDDADTSSSEASTAGLSTAIGTTSTPATPASHSKNWRPYVYHCPRDDCDRIFNRPCRLAEHMRSHTDERPYKCSQDGCDKTFRRDTHLSRHIKTAHSDERNHPCTWPGCDKRFANGTRMRRHYDTHEQKEQFRCTGYPPCNEIFRKHKTLQSHVAAVHLNEKPWPCTHIDQETGMQCTRAYNSEGKLHSHQAKAHSGELRFACTLCEAQSNEDSEEEVQRFATQIALKEHIQQEHPPKCEECNVVFESQGDLASHIDHMHTEISERALFHCEEFGCGKAFAKRNNLKEHIRIIHKGEKRFVCGTTDVSGSSKFEEEVDGQIVKHEWNGEGCSRAFGTKATLEEHVRTQHLGLEGSVRAKKRKQLIAEGRDPDAVAKLGRMAGGATGKGSKPRRTGLEVQDLESFDTLVFDGNANVPTDKFYLGGLGEDTMALDDEEMAIDVSTLNMAMPGRIGGFGQEWESPDCVPVDPILQLLNFES